VETLIGGERGACSSSTVASLPLKTFRTIRIALNTHLSSTFSPQLPMLKARWKQILFGALFQYVHAMSTQLAHRMHEPQEEPLGDIGFSYLPVRLPPCFYLLND